MQGKEIMDKESRLLALYNLILAISKDKYAVPEMMAERITKEVDEVVARSVKARDKEWLKLLADNVTNIYQYPCHDAVTRYDIVDKDLEALRGK